MRYKRLFWYSIAATVWITLKLRRQHLEYGALSTIVHTYKQSYSTAQLQLEGAVDTLVVFDDGFMDSHRTSLGHSRESSQLY